MTNQYADDDHNPRVTDEERAEIRRLHAEGHGRNEISRRTGRSLRTISVQAARMGLAFDRTATEEATRARMADLAERRAILAEALTDDALRLSAQLWEPAVVYSFGGPTNSYSEHAVPEPPASDKRLLMAAATNAAATSLRLVPAQDGEGVDGAASMLGHIMSGLEHVYRDQKRREAGEIEGDGDAP
ncbi:helix-turn-helix domain-containing protein [Streptomyces sp. NPDC101115]|uniref:helix-turn-helix domain-containing protein n=1 Tax=Streptomyces sp. NPDC101115 TaxID=3366106 RepID=UPI003827B359